MTKAAVGLHLTQSALSHQLRDIESRFNTPFFLRVGKRMVLTAAGRRVLESAVRILEDLGRVEEDVRHLAQNHDGVIRVATQCNTGYHWLPPLLARFNRKHPRVTVSIMADATDRPVQALLDGQLDLAILTNDVSDPRLKLRRLFTDEMVVLVSRHHRWASRTSVSPRQLADEHLLLYSSSPEESFVLQRVLTPAGVTPARLSFIMLTEAMIEMARAGLGVAGPPAVVGAISDCRPIRDRAFHHAARYQEELDGGDAEGSDRARLARRFHRLDRGPGLPRTSERPGSPDSMSIPH